VCNVISQRFAFEGLMIPARCSRRARRLFGPDRESLRPAFSGESRPSQVPPTPDALAGKLRNAFPTRVAL